MKFTKYKHLNFYFETLIVAFRYGSIGSGNNFKQAFNQGSVFLFTLKTKRMAFIAIRKAINIIICIGMVV